jgi:hypothetical protein
LYLPNALACDAEQFTSLLKLSIGPQYKPAAQASEPPCRDLHIFKQVGTRAFGTAFTRWRVGLV